MPPTGIERIDGLIAGTSGPIGPDEPDQFAIGAIQDLLHCWYPSIEPIKEYLPKGKGLREAAPLFFRGSQKGQGVYGEYTDRTVGLVRGFQRKWNTRENPPWTLRTDGTVDRLTLQSMLLFPARLSPFVTPGYFLFAKEKNLTHLLKALVLIASQECACKFETTNRNQDLAGLSLGIIHWAQKPGRLADPIKYFYQQEPDELAKLFGDEPGAKHENIKKVIAHLEKGKAALYSDDDPPPKERKEGDSIDRDLEFARPDPGKTNWYQCFQNMLKSRLFQQLMFDFALATIRRMYDENSPDYPTGFPKIQGEGLLQWGGEKIKSEKGVIFTLDLINQHGGKPKVWYAKITKDKPDISEQELLETFKDHAKKFWIKKKPPEDKKKPEQKQVEKQNSESDERRRNFILNTWFTDWDKPFVPKVP
jgi:hypothetical protein